MASLQAREGAATSRRRWVLLALLAVVIFSWFLYPSRPLEQVHVLHRDSTSIHCTENVPVRNVAVIGKSSYASDYLSDPQIQVLDPQERLQHIISGNSKLPASLSMSPSTSGMNTSVAAQPPSVHMTTPIIQSSSEHPSLSKSTTISSLQRKRSACLSRA